MYLKYFWQQKIIVILLLGIVLLSNYHNEILAAFPSLSGYFVLILSFLLCVIILIILINQIRDVEVLKAEFVKVIAHKFRTPLTEIRWATENLKNPSTTIHDRDLALNQIDQSRQKLNEIVDLLTGLLKFDNQMEYAFEAVSFRELFDESLLKYSKQIRDKKISFSIQQNPDIPLIIIDGKKIQFILDTLLDNAINYNKTGGEIITTINHDKNGIIFKISDSGIGIEKGNLNKIFSKFYRGKNARLADTEGLGLSLHIAGEIAKKHKGTLVAYSKGLDKGSTFILTIPKRTA